MDDLTADLARRLVAEQFPAWAHLEVTGVERQGWDNRTFRLGTDLTVRLPSAAAYTPAVDKEHRHLPALAAHLPIPVPEPVALGAPTGDFPHPWSIRRWLEGETIDVATGLDRDRLANDLGRLLTILRSAPAADGPAAGQHSFYRGCHPSAYADQVQAALRELEARVDTAACEAVWAAALTSVWEQSPVWFHGDIAAGNLLAANGRLSALIDFGTCGVGDPACDLVIAWTYFDGDERRIFREAAGLDEGAWRRARGWALWKALILIARVPGADTDGAQTRILTEILTDPLTD
ncbi:aminoglycoside phosphotransferase family protein [Glycomyces sp. NRRL B-16210]|uniref:aminoglycoside phosphotransferase family protein n=1 Tax=Glycomyces sp. NRRL B-16210 TaxID=1463821 RepID=UPI0004BE9A5F|nr:aminoglycoside phosphotransferase family protein [Glycomyces sp. NRRL B-16210]